MDIELVEIKDFIASHHPFSLLPEDELSALARAIVVRYLRRDAMLMEPGERVEALSIVRSGALETFSPEGDLLARLDAGQAGGVRALLRGGLAVNRIQAIEDSLIYQVPADHFHRLREDYPSFAYFFAPQAGERLRGAKASGGASDTLGLTTRRVGELLRREPLTVRRETPIRDAARAMAEGGVSCLLVVDDAGDLVGILTDRDLRGRVVAAGLDITLPVTEIMTSPPLSVQATAWLFEAMLMMSRHTIHHLPVVRGDKPVGVITTTDLLRTQTRSVVFLASDIHRRDDADGIRECTQHIPDLVYELVEGGATARSVGKAITALADAATQRLIQITEVAMAADFGPPPVPYCWIAAGSQARFEQTALSDQDNSLVISDDYDEAAHGAWFKEFSTRVCTGLATAGYILCPGEMMAMTDQWRQPLRVWKDYFRRWIDQPEPKALMLSSVFFDMRPIAGDTTLFDTLQAEVLARAQGSRLFLGLLTGNALTHQPPLGFFRNFVLIHDGEHNNTLDLKHAGIVPIVDLARIYALDAGLPAINTWERLQGAREAGTISGQGADDLEDALEFLGLVRLRHQARQIREGEKADNYLPPKELSNFERTHLKDAFAVVKSMQQAAVASYRGGRG